MGQGIRERAKDQPIRQVRHLTALWSYQAVGPSKGLQPKLHGAGTKYKLRPIIGESILQMIISRQSDESLSREANIVGIDVFE